MRSVVIIDASYLLHAGSSLCRLGAPVEKVRCDVAGFQDSLEAAVRLDCEQPLLRTYWYGADIFDGVEARLRDLDGRPRTKVRSGSVSWGAWKETKILLHQEMVDLARGALIATMYLLSGDGDFRPTVETVQARGVEVVLVGLAGGSVGANLARSVDRRLELPAEAVSPHFSV